MRPKLASVLSDVRSSIWLRPILRLVLALAGVLALACIGRFVAAGGPVPPAAAAAAQAPPPPDAAASSPPPPAVDATPTLDAAPPPSTPAPPRGAQATEDDPVYLNEATLDDLRRLPGVASNS